MAMHLRRGDRLGPYEVVAPIGAGGMGEVYRARDTRLERDVAIKVLPDSQAANQNARARFEREARSIAALSHPNICAIFDVGSEGDAQYLVMEYMEGEPLDSRLARGPLPTAELLRHGAEIANALAAAHRIGIVHRDLKPANVMITRTGARLLDFGLARRSSPVPEEAPAAEAPTAVRSLTAEGAVVGTLQYMSPEQLHGEELDQRSDIFSLGALLFEMATGRKAFAGASRASVVAAILSGDPLSSAGSEPLAPLGLERIVRTCLAKSRDDRWESAGDVGRELTWLGEGAQLVSAPTPAAPPKPGRRAVMLGAAAAAIVLLALGVRWAVDRDGLSASPRPAIRSMAVLPFESSTREASAEMLSDGITEGLINTLSRLRDLRVIARTTAFTFKGQALDLDEVRRKLDVDAVLTGKVVSREAELIVQADLIDARTGTQLWGERYVRPANGALSIEQEIVGRITDQIRPAIEPGERTRIVAAPTTSAEAYALYLSGRQHIARRTADDIQRARSLFESAVGIDARFALAHAGIAETYALINYQGGPAVRDEYLPKAEAAARRALEITPDLGEAHATLGLVALHRYHFRAAERQLRRAIELNGNFSHAHQWLSLTLDAEGRPAEALAAARRAQSLDPLSTAIRSCVALELSVLGRPEEAIAEARASLAIAPDSQNGIAALGRGLEEAREYALAAQAFDRLLGNSQAFAAKGLHLARVSAKQGKTAEAAAVARELEEQWKKSPDEVSAALLASVYAALGDRERAFAWLDRALDARTLKEHISAPALFGSIRTDPRFERLLERMYRIEDEELGRSTRPTAEAVGR